MKEKSLERPQITDMTEPVQILRVMLSYRKQTEKSYSVLNACRGLYRVSPTLVTLILKGARKITPDRVDELSKLMSLTGSEKIYFKNLVLQNSDMAVVAPTLNNKFERSRKNVSTHILSDWLHVYVKDCFHILEVQKNPDLIYRQLGPLASNKRIQKSLQFLLREGYLRRSGDGRIVIETNLAVAETPVPNQKVRRFHKAALNVAHQAIDLHHPSERLANTLLVCISKDRYQELLALTQEFAEKLKRFAEVSSPADDRLYQLVVNLSPTGGKVE